MKFWSSISAYYDTLHIDAWNNQVPFHVTNNPVIAKRLAYLVTHYILSSREKGYTEKFVIIEPGAGLGKFAFFFLQNLVESLQLLHLPLDCVEYLLCDKSKKTKGFWEKHPQLQSFIQSDHLSCHTLHVSEHLAVSFSYPVAQLKQKRLIFLANYFLDSLYQSPYIYDYNHDRYAPCTIHEKKSFLSGNSSLQFTPVLIESPPFSDCATYQSILESHHTNFSSHRVLMPDGAMALMQWLDQLTNLPVLFINTDKGYTNPQHSFYQENFNIVRTGTFASMVNFFALDQYTQKALSGSSILFREHESFFGTCLMMSKEQMHTYTSFHLAAHQLIKKNSSYNTCQTQNLIHHQTKFDSFQDAMDGLSIGHYDLTSLSHIFGSIKPVIESLEDFSEYPIRYALQQFRSNFFYTPHPDSERELLYLIQFARITKHFDLCIEALELMQSLYGESHAFYLEYGMVYFMQSDFLSASRLFEESLSANPECPASAHYLAHCHALLQ